MTATGEVKAEKLLKDLANVWKELGQSQKDYAVVRACALTLVVATKGEDDVQELAGTLGDLMHSHPSRYIVLRIVDRPEPEFTARVFAQCQLAFGRRQQVCCEQIEFLSTGDRLLDFHAVALGLTVADLPVLLWIKSADLLFDDNFRKLLRLARPVIIDSNQWASPAAGVKELARLRRDGWRIKDLNWTRLTVWRETVAQMFEQAACRDLVANIESVEVTGEGDQLGSDVAYLGAWLTERLPHAQVTASGRGVQRLAFHGGGKLLEITATAGALTASALDGMVTRIPSPVRSDADLLTEDLSILGPDSTFAAVLKSAADHWPE